MTPGGPRGPGSCRRRTGAPPPFAVTMDYAGTTSFAGEATTSANSANGFASGTLIGVQVTTTAR